MNDERLGVVTSLITFANSPPWANLRNHVNGSINQIAAF